jgi:hypothetical protein
VTVCYQLGLVPSIVLDCIYEMDPYLLEILPGISIDALVGENVMLR